MPHSTATIDVAGTTAADSQGVMLVLSQRLEGYDTFLTGRLEFVREGTSFGVRILTFDDVTVLRFVDDPPAHVEPEWHGLLHLPHGSRPRVLPDDLRSAACSAGRDLTSLDEAELRYAVTFLNEATTHDIRQGRIDAIVSALPASSPELR